MEYVGRYSDSMIYDILEDPGDIVRDVYRVLLETAVERNLIDRGESDRLLREARRADMTILERKIDISNEVFDDIFFKREEILKQQTEVGQEDYWMCPSCGESVGMNLSECWNCQAGIPENPEHPVIEEVVTEVHTERIPKTPGRMGVALIICGVLGILAGIARGLGRVNTFGELLTYRIEVIIIGSLAILAGILLLIYSSSGKGKLN